MVYVVLGQGWGLGGAMGLRANRAMQPVYLLISQVDLLYLGLWP